MDVAEIFGSSNFVFLVIFALVIFAVFVVDFIIKVGKWRKNAKDVKNQ